MTMRKLINTMLLRRGKRAQRQAIRHWYAATAGIDYAAEAQRKYRTEHPNG